jgi:hypothetical protein
MASVGPQIYLVDAIPPDAGSLPSLPLALTLPRRRYAFPHVFPV